MPPQPMALRWAAAVIDSSTVSSASRSTGCSDLATAVRSHRVLSRVADQRNESRMQGSCRCLLAIAAAVAGLLSGDALRRMLHCRQEASCAWPVGRATVHVAAGCHCIAVRNVRALMQTSRRRSLLNRASRPNLMRRPNLRQPLPQITPSLNNSYGLVDAQSSVPWMMGDFFGNSCVPIQLV